MLCPIREEKYIVTYSKQSHHKPRELKFIGHTSTLERQFFHTMLTHEKSAASELTMNTDRRLESNVTLHDKQLTAVQILVSFLLIFYTALTLSVGTISLRINSLLVLL